MMLSDSILKILREFYPEDLNYYKRDIDLTPSEKKQLKDFDFSSLDDVRKDVKAQNQQYMTDLQRSEVDSLLNKINQEKTKFQKTVDTVKDYGNKAADTVKKYGSKAVDYAKEHPYHAAGITAAAIAAGLGARALAKKLKKK